MLRIVNLEHVQGTLLRVRGLMDHLERHDPNFVLEVKRWLAELEESLADKSDVHSRQRGGAPRDG